MIEPLEQFGICWHCDNLMVSSHKEDEIIWKATCVAIKHQNTAMFVDDGVYERRWYTTGDTSFETFRRRTLTCSKYKVLSW